MKTRKLIWSKITLLLVLAFSVFISCEQDLSDDATLATFTTSGEVYLDGFSAGLQYFPFGGSYFEAFSVDTETFYAGSSSMRFDVPNVGDPNGSFAGAVFPDLNGGRDLSGYDALTFYAKGTIAGTVDAFGFGDSFGVGGNKYLTTLQGVHLTTNWRKYIIPLPDPSKLTQEAGMFWYAEGPEGGSGYTFWVDELQYEKLGTVAQPRPKILDGNDVVQQSFLGATLLVTGLTQTFNLGTGVDETVSAAPGYFVFTSSNPGIATVDEFGVVTIVGTGTTVITATLNGIDAAGSLTVESLGNFELAPTPTLPASDVISIFSDAYTNVPVDFYNGYWEPFQTTESADFVINGDNILNYTNFNFVGNQFSNPTVDATDKSNLSLDMYIPGDIPSNFDFLISVVDFGPDGEDGGGDDTRQQIFVSSSDVASNAWVTLRFPLTLANKDNLGLIIYENINGSSLSNFYLDNIYFYGTAIAPSDAPPIPTVPAANVISVFSDAYTDVPNDGLNNFDSGSILSVETIASNAVLKYSNLNFTGLEFLGPNIINASDATTLHLDVWSPDANELKIKLVDFGADGAFGGGDDSEYEINFGPTATNEWVAYDIPLSDFIGLTSTEHLAQIILVNAPTGTLFVDNLYFYN
jgi:hypothetical protein